VVQPPLRIVSHRLHHQKVIVEVLLFFALSKNFSKIVLLIEGRSTLHR
jgi:hypothetical protein